ncbi:MAG: MFS transporter [Actinophytocola sp.]|nr:MFS transporter [Actinophytocola sp.]
MLRVSAGAVAISVVTVLPMFLTAGLAVQIGADLDFSPSALGIAPAAFFGAMVLGSPFAGRLVERVGALGAIRGVVLFVAVLLALIAGTASSLTLLVAYLAAAGIANALGQPATNQLVAQRILPTRQGVAYGAKYSAIPVASMLAGVAVPLLGLTVGWRWAFAVFALFASFVALWPFGQMPGRSTQANAQGSGTRLPRRILLVLAVGVSFAAAGGSTLAIFMVASAVDTGWGEARAGVLFAAASAVGVAARLLSGVRADQRGRNHLWVVSLMLVAGAIGVAALAMDNLVLFAIGAPLAFGAGWGWPGVFILSIVNLNPTGPAAATALTQVGTSAGCVFGPLTFGVLAENSSYGTAWAVNALTLLVAAAVIVMGRRQVLNYLSTLPSGIVPSRDRDQPTRDLEKMMTNQKLVESYFAACTGGDAGAIAEHFCEDAVVYDLNHDPVRGATTIGDFYVRVRDRWKGATWEVNTYAEGVDTAAIEWTMRGTNRDKPFAVRGSEHYEFRDGAIRQIRQYWAFDRKNPDVGLRGYPYASDARFTAGEAGVDAS